MRASSRSRSPSADGKRADREDVGDMAADAALRSREAEVASMQRQLHALTNQLAAVTSDNAALKTQLATAITVGAAAAGGVGGMPGAPGAVAVPHGELVEFERQLRDKSAQVLLLKSR
jgi:hypothetical protein